MYFFLIRWVGFPLIKKTNIFDFSQRPLSMAIYLLPGQRPLSLYLCLDFFCLIFPCVVDMARRKKTPMPVAPRMFLFSGVRQKAVLFFRWVMSVTQGSFGNISILKWLAHLLTLFLRQVCLTI